jgi:fermentation-respiration switch protein FrsA (DUF1100 family)
MKAAGIQDHAISRRALMFATGAGVLAVSMIAAPKQGRAELSNDWDKTFAKSDKVDSVKVTYRNRLGIDLVADLYTPRGMDPSRNYPALVVGHPFGGVKEQSSGLYAQQMAERGFIALAHDASYNGESGGKPYRTASPDIYVEDFSAGADFLGMDPRVDRERLGVIGVCASGGFALSAAQIDPRFKAIATSALYDMGWVIRDGFDKSNTDEMRKGMLAAINQQRYVDLETGTPAMREQPTVLPTDADPITAEFFEYYRTQRGAHPRSSTGITVTSAPSFFHFRPLDHMEWITPRPVLMIAGEIAHSRLFTEEAFARASEPKELIVVPGARHIDLYDRVDMIPFDRLGAFFTQHLLG